MHPETGKADFIQEANMIVVTAAPLEPESLYKMLRKKNSGSVIFHYAVD